MPYTNQDYAVTLPNQANPSQVLQQGIQLRERQQERADALAERQRQFDEREKDRAEAAKYKQAEFVDKNTTIPQSVLTGSGKYGTMATNQVGALASKYFSMFASGAPISAVQTAMQQEVPNVVAALGAAKGELEGVDKSVKYLQDKFGEDIDATKLRQTLLDDVDKRYIDPKTGGLANPVMIQPSQVQQNLANPDNLAQFLKSTTGIDKYFKEDTKKNKIFVKNGEGQYVFKAPNLPYAKGNWSEGEAIHPEGFNPQYSVKGHDVPTPHLDKQLGEGTYPPIKVLDDEPYKEFLDANPHNEAYLSKMAQDQYGAKNWSGFNEHAKDIAKKQIAYKLAEKGIQNNLPTMDDIIKPPRTNINVNSGAVAKQDVLDNNSGTLKQHLEDAITNNPITVKVPLNGGGYGTATWGDLGKSDLTEPFKVTVTVPNADSNKPSTTKSVPYDKYLVSNDEKGDKKIYGVYYKRNVDGEMTDKYDVQKEIPLERYTERLVRGTTPLKYRADVIKQNVEEVRGSKKKESAPKVSADDFNAKWSKLKKGESMVAPDGKTYVKQ